MVQFQIMIRRPFIFYALILSLCGLVYVSQYWSPSSYGIVLRHIGVEEVGTVFGQPRGIRQDEWAVGTPWTQATVNNNFERINKTSFYKEDFRIMFGLPIFDWGLVFKPTMWLYPIADPAHAYSFHWFAILALFIVGYALLFARFGLGEMPSILLATGLYFTGFAQFWWNGIGPNLAFFPWVVWVLLLRIPIVVRLILFYWLGTSWLIINFYPPLFVSLAFVGALIILAVGREWLQPRKLILLVVATACAGMTAAIYLKDYLLKTSTTIYPGQRKLSGGTVPWQEWWSQIFPFGTFDWRYESVIGQNICEVGVVGSALILMTLCFLDYQKFFEIMRADAEYRRRVLILLSGLLLMTAWMMLPLPSWMGIPLLWNYVQPDRMVYAAGLLALLVMAIVGKEAGIIISDKRLVAYVVLVIAGWLALKQIRFDSNTEFLTLRSNDLIVIPVLLVILVLDPKGKISQHTLLLAASVICGAVMLFSFNPIQSAKNFFVQHDTPFIRAIEQRIQESRGYLAISGMPGSTLNGLGYASVSHVTAIPVLEFWRQKYPDMKEADFLGIFNRYSHITLIQGTRPVLLAFDNVGVPLADFLPDYVEVPGGIEGPGIALWLPQGSTVSGELMLNRAGRILAVGVLIGNGYNSSDGVLTLQLCWNGHCVSAGRSLAESIDNAFLHFKFDQPLVIYQPGSVQYEFQLRDGTRPVALWTYKEPSPTSVTLVAAGQNLSSVPRFRIEYDPQGN